MIINTSGLSRITSAQRFIPVIDGLRMVAISWVILFHINQFYGFNGPLSSKAHSDPLFHLLNIGDFGVRLFFTLSGFILTLPFAEQHLLAGKGVDIKRYFWRRITRLEPPYIISLLVYVTAGALAGLYRTRTPWSDFLQSLLYANLATHQMPHLNYVTWSLEIEVQFYILAPLLTMLLACRSTALRRSLLLLTMLVFGSVKTFFHPEPFWCLTDELQYFLAGILLCDFYVASWRTPSHVPLRWDLLGALAWIALVTVLLHKIWVAVAAPPLICVAYAAALRGRLWNKVLSLRLLVLIGGMCYTTYLYHVFLLAIPATFSFHLLRIGDSYGANVLLQCCLLTPLVFAASVPLFVIGERPFMVPNWPVVLWNKLSPSRTATVEAALIDKSRGT
jgi:peptidoglycan/LPS O-acetylase OafA/YrhL